MISFFSLWWPNCLEGIKTEDNDDFEYRSRATGRLTGWKGGNMVGELLSRNQLQTAWKDVDLLRQQTDYQAVNERVSAANDKTAPCRYSPSLASPGSNEETHPY